MRLIDADVACEGCVRYGTDLSCENCVVNDAPTIDAVEVVRCRDCKFGTHFGDMEDEWIRCINLHGNPLMPFDGFCSYGERKEGTE